MCLRLSAEAKTCAPAFTWTLPGPCPDPTLTLQKRAASENLGNLQLGRGGSGGVQGLHPLAWASEPDFVNYSVTDYLFVTPDSTISGPLGLDIDRSKNVNSLSGEVSAGGIVITALPQ